MLDKVKMNEKHSRWGNSEWMPPAGVHIFHVRSGHALWAQHINTREMTTLSRLLFSFHAETFSTGMVSIGINIFSNNRNQPPLHAASAASLAIVPCFPSQKKWIKNDDFCLVLGPHFEWSLINWKNFVNWIFRKLCQILPKYWRH